MVQTKEDGLTENGQMTLSSGVGATLQELSHAALDRQRWAAIVRMASDTNRHWAHGCRWWWWWWAVIAHNWWLLSVVVECCQTMITIDECRQLSTCANKLHLLLLSVIQKSFTTLSIFVDYLGKWLTFFRQWQKFIHAVLLEGWIWIRNL